jgi:hypothetical protein
MLPLGDSTVPAQTSKQSSEQEEDACQWTDGSAEKRRSYRRENSRSSSSRSESSFISRMIGHSHLLASHHLFGKGKRRGRPKPQSARPRLSSLQNFACQAIFKIPSPLRLRRTQSNPRTTPPAEQMELQVFDTRRNSSTPTTGSPMSYPYVIPEIRRFSASTVGVASTPGTTSGQGQCFTTHKHYSGYRLRSSDCGKLSPPLPADCDLKASHGQLETLSHSEEYRRFQDEARQSDYLNFLGNAHRVAAERAESGQSNSSKHQRSVSDYCDEMFSASVSSSEDSLAVVVGKRKPVVGSPVNSAETFSSRLREREADKYIARHDMVDSD